MSVIIVVVTVANNVECVDLIRMDYGLNHGVWNNGKGEDPLIGIGYQLTATGEPPPTISSQSTFSWSSVSDGTATGTQGWARYYPLSRTIGVLPAPIPDEDTIYIEWDNPFCGDDSFQATQPYPYLLTQTEPD